MFTKKYAPLYLQEIVVVKYKQIVYYTSNYSISSCIKLEYNRNNSNYVKYCLYHTDF